MSEGSINKTGSIVTSGNDRGNYSSTLSEDALAAIRASSGSSDDSGSGDSTPPTGDAYWSCGHPKTIDHRHLGKIAMGKKFEINGSTVNSTYGEWVANLDLLVSNGYINECMKVSFLQLNLYNRDHATVEDPDGEPETPSPIRWWPYFTT